MKIIHFTQIENQEGDKLDLNDLKPVSEYQKQVVFDVEERLDKELSVTYTKKQIKKQVKNIRPYADRDQFIENIILLDKYNLFKKLEELSYLSGDENVLNYLFEYNIEELIECFVGIGLINDINDLTEIIHKSRYIEDNFPMVVFLSNKGFIKNIEDFDNLVNLDFFLNLDFELFKKNFEYLEKKLGEKLELGFFDTVYFVKFVKYLDIDNLEFWLKNINSDDKEGGKYRDFSRVNTFEKIIKNNSRYEEFANMTKFLIQPGLAKKIELFYMKDGKDFDFKDFCSYVFNKGIDLGDIGNSNAKVFINYKRKVNNSKKDIKDFSYGVELFFKKYENLKTDNFKDTYYLFDLIDNIGENIFLFEHFDISYDYFKNMKMGTDKEDTRFIDFLVNADTKVLKFIIKNIKEIKFKDLFSMYKVNDKITNTGYKIGKNLEFFEIQKKVNNKNKISKIHNKLGIIKELYNFAFLKNNYYFLWENIVMINSFDILIFEKINFSKIIEVLEKTGGFITKSLFKNYVLEDKGNLDEIWDKYQNAMKKVLSSEEIKKEDLNEFLYEAIFMAYRPTNLSEESIKNMIENGGVEDLTHQLNNIKFNNEGYDLVASKNMKVLDGKLEYGLFEEYIERIFSNMGNFPFRKKFFDIKKFFSKTTEFKELLIEFEDLYSINEDDRIKAFRDKYFDFDELKEVYDELDLLNQAYEIFGVVTKDSFSKYLIKELNNLEEGLIDEILLEMEILKDPRFKKEFEEEKEKITGNGKNIDLNKKKILIANLTEKRIIEFGNFMRKKINKELKKFKTTRGEEKCFKAIISKNIGSFFAEAGAELCDWRNIKKWNEKRFIHLNLIDQERNQIVGNIMLYFEENRDYLIVRGFNPIREIVNNYDNKQLISGMIVIVKEIAKQNGLDRVYIPKVDFGWHNLSNRDKIQKLVWGESEKNIAQEEYVIKNANFYQTDIGNGNMVDELYLL